MSATDIILIVVACLLLVIAYQLNKIGEHVDTLRRLGWAKMFGEPPKD